MSPLIFVLVFFSFTMPASGMMTGGVAKQDPSSPEFMTKAWKSAKTLNEESSNAGAHLMIPIKVVKAETQVVAGFRYILEVLFGESTCKKGDVPVSEISAANCQLMENGNRALYKVDLWEKPWQNFEQFSVSKIRDVSNMEQF